MARLVATAIAVVAAIGLTGVALANHLHLEKKLLGSTGDADDQHGYAVAIDGDLAVVGAPRCDGRVNTTGCAYVYRRNEAGVWVEEARLTSLVGTNIDRFGHAVAIEGNTIVIGVPQQPVLRREAAGVVYVYRHEEESGWFIEAKFEGSWWYEYFGTSVAIDGDTIAVGATGAETWGYDAGAVHVYRRFGTSWFELQTLIAPDGALGDNFGSSVGVSGATVAVGARYDDDAGSSSGSVYLFEETVPYQWTPTAKLVPATGRSFDNFGDELAIDANRMVVGSLNDDTASPNAGAAYVYRSDGGVWSLERMLTAPDAVSNDRFGAAVSIRGETLVVGSPFDDDDGSSSGAVYVYVRVGEQWVLDAKRTASDAASFDNFGSAVSVGTDRMIVGSPFDDDQGNLSGAAYVYERTFGNQPPNADAGNDRNWECASETGGPVTLDGSGSSDPDSNPGTNDDIVRFVWFEDFGTPDETPLGEGEVIEVTLSLGAHQVTLRATDRAGLTDTDTVTHTVRDTSPPVISLTTDPEELWPPNHRLIRVTSAATASDNCGVPTITLHSIDSDEPDNGTGIGDGNTTEDIQDADYGTADFEVRLRAERAGTGDGRTYTVRYAATDPFGNVGIAESLVVVPHSKGNKTEPVEETLEETEQGTVVGWTAVDGALNYNVVRGNLADIVETPAELDLGTVWCVENGSLNENTTGWEDPEVPPPGQAFFYLVEYFDGAYSDYGTESAPKPRVIRSGRCE